jgi:predicted nucleotidyltransferase
MLQFATTRNDPHSREQAKRRDKHLQQGVLLWASMIRRVQSLMVATVLAVVPSLVVRGFTNRIITWWRGDLNKHE